MIDHELSNLNEVIYKHIEDIIDARKRLGHYNVDKQSNLINYRYVYSTSIGANERFVRFNDSTVLNEADSSNGSTIKHTDSEITVVRIRRDNSMKKNQIDFEKWDMEDVAIPGDGTHLGESPSLVNLATLVGQNIYNEGDEYLVPLSSWDPQIKMEKSASRQKYLVDSSVSDDTDSKEDDRESVAENKGIEDRPSTEHDLNLSGIITRRSSLAGRISKFIRRRLKQKSLSEEGEKM